MISKLFLGNDKNLERKGFFWTILSGITYSLSSLLFLMAVTNVLGDISAGIYSLGMLVAQQLLTVGKFSVRNYQVSDVTGKYSFEEYLSFRLITCILMILIAVGWIFFGGYKGNEALVIICFTIYKMGESLSDVFEGLYQQKFRIDVSGKSQFIKNFIMIVSFVGIVIFKKDLILASIVLAAEAVITIVVFDFPLTLKFAKLRLRISFKALRGLAMACMPMFISSFLYIYINNSPKYAIMDIGGDEGTIALAHFNMLFMPVFAVDLLAGFTMRVWLGKMSIYHAQRDWKGFKQLLLKQIGIISLITIGSMLVMYFAGGWFLSLLYGTNLHGYEIENALLMFSGGLVSIYTLFENVTIIYRHQHLSIVINIISTIVAAVVVPIMTRYNGIMGATVGYVIANAVRALGYFLNALYYMIKEKNLTPSDSSE